MSEARPEHSPDLLEANKRLLEKRAVAKSKGVQEIKESRAAPVLQPEPDKSAETRFDPVPDQKTEHVSKFDKHGPGCTCEKCFGKKNPKSSNNDAPPSMRWTPVLIAPGRYEAVVVKREIVQVRRFHWKKMLYLWFRILTPGPYFQGEIFRSYSYENISPTCIYAKDWINANGGQRPERWDRMSPLIFDGKAFIITVRNVQSGLYSVVASIERLAAGGANGKN